MFVVCEKDETFFNRVLKLFPAVVARYYTIFDKRHTLC